MCAIETSYSELTIEVLGTKSPSHDSQATKR